MEDDHPYKAKERVEALIKSLRTLIQKDPEQEVQGFALPVLDAALTDVKQAMPNDPVLRSLVDLFSADFIGAGEPVRAADMLLVAEQLDAAIGSRPFHIGIAQRFSPWAASCRRPETL
jgi:hypothetical protein